VALLDKAIRPATSARFDVFLWLQETDAELLLASLLANEPAVRSCISRHEVLRQNVDEATAIVADHSPSRYGAAWRADTTPNTLRMLHKLRGVEQLRRATLASLGDGAQHAWVLRVRPDLELLEPLPLPPFADADAAAAAVVVPWECPRSQLLSDQLLLLRATDEALGGASAAERLGALYEPGTLLEASRRSAPPSLYPERIAWHALRGLTRRTWPGGSGGGPPRLQLVGARGEARDAYAKLAEAFPECFSRGAFAANG